MYSGEEKRDNRKRNHSKKPYSKEYQEGLFIIVEETTGTIYSSYLTLGDALSMKKRLYNKRYSGYDKDKIYGIYVSLDIIDEEYAQLNFNKERITWAGKKEE